ncbi:uncharacterized protein LOC102807363 [Saccoglossus kowalevskii]
MSGIETTTETRLESYTGYICCDGWETFPDCDIAICDPSCHVVQGVCIEPDVCDCISGWTGATCTEECSDDTWGPNCDSACLCENGAECDRFSGECECTSGWLGVYCDTPCTYLTWGVGCMQNCSGNCFNGETCDNENGVCVDGCAPGYKGDECDEICEIGSYGQDCSGVCGRCDGGGCDHVNGTCSTGCEAGYTGILCNEECPIGTYGINCSEQCGNCYNAPTCNNVNGTCVHGCTAGLMGDLCMTSCPAGSYGRDCSQFCQCQNDAISCDIINGTCDCAVGYTGLSCEHECSGGYYGMHCAEVCRCLYESSCHHIDGTCTCQCQHNATCDVYTGECNCTVGYNGTFCENKCSSGYYGMHCTEVCHCQNEAECHHINGECSCQYGFIGTHCEYNWILIVSLLFGIILFLSILPCFFIAMCACCAWYKKRKNEQAVTPRQIGIFERIKNLSHQTIKITDQIDKKVSDDQPILRGLPPSYSPPPPYQSNECVFMSNDTLRPQTASTDDGQQNELIDLEEEENEEEQETIAALPLSPETQGHVEDETQNLMALLEEIEEATANEKEAENEALRMSVVASLANDDHSKYAALNASRRASMKAKDERRRRLSKNLKYAIKLRDRGKLERSARDFKAAKIPDPDNDLVKAERILKEFKVKDGLLDAISRRELEELEWALRCVEENGFTESLHQEVTTAVQIVCTLRRLEKLRREILNLKQSIWEVHKYPTPKPEVHSVMKAVFVLLGKDEEDVKNWKQVQVLMGKLGRKSLRYLIMTCDIATIPAWRAQTANKILGKLTLDQVRDVSAGATTFYIWLCGMSNEVVMRARDFTADEGESEEAANIAQKYRRRLKKMRETGL